MRLIITHVHFEATPVVIEQEKELTVQFVSHEAIRQHGGSELPEARKSPHRRTGRAW